MPNSDNNLVEIINSFRQGVAVINREGFILLVNRAWHQHSLDKGIPSSFEWTGVNLLPVYNALAEAEGLSGEELDQVLTGSQPYLRREFQYSRRLEMKWYTIEASTIYKLDGQTVKGALICIADITRNKMLELNHLKALAQICTLHGLLPICAVCKQIRDEHNIWSSIESFLEKHTHVEFTHDICPECIRRLYPEYSSMLDEPSCS